MRNDLLRARPRLRTAAVVLAGVLLTSGLAAAGAAADPAAKFSPRVQSILGELTLDEKLSLVHGGDDPNSVGEAGFVPGVPRLGIPSLRLADGSAGVRVDKPSVVMPAPVSLASSFDESLATRYGAGVGREARALGTDVLLSPMVKHHPDPVRRPEFRDLQRGPTADVADGGRRGAGHRRPGHHPGRQAPRREQPGERPADDRRRDGRPDAARGRAARVRGGGQGRGRRGDVLVQQPQRALRARESPLTGILREQLAFQGWVMSDWRMSLTPDSLPKGLDQEMPAGTYFGDQLKAAITAGTIPQSALDSAVGTSSVSWTVSTCWTARPGRPGTCPG